MYRGSCLCGGVKYRIEGAIEVASNCHCTQCRKQHGAAFASYGSVRASSFSYLDGVELLASYASSPGVERVFCGRCGSSLTWRSAHRFSNYVSVALGTLDDPYEGPVHRDIHTDARVRWLPHD